MADIKELARRLLELGYTKDNLYYDDGRVYIVQPGDTLSDTSKILTGKASNYRQLAAANKTEDADKIYVGQKIVIPEKFDRPLKLSEIPTNNKVHVIDNYSPKWNYIVEGDKIYYSRKGRDYWVDISDNEVARRNLYGFLRDKYNFRGYEDDEKEIGDRVEKGTFDYHQYRDSVNTEARNYNEKLRIAQKWENADLGDKSFSDLMPPIKSESAAKSEKSARGHEPEKKYSVKQLLNEKVPFTESPYYIGNAALPFWSKSSVTQDPQKKKAEETDTEEWTGQSSSDDRSFFKKTVDDISTLASMGVNWASRQIKKISNDDERSVMMRPTYSGLEGDSEYGIVPGSFTGDTLSVRANARRYILPESLDMDDYTFGVRNRGDMAEIHSEAAPITAFRPFRKYGEHAKGYKTYIGMGADGRLKVGDISKFGDGDMLTGTYANKVYSFAKDKDGNYIWQSDSKHGNRNQNVAAVITEDEKTGEKKQAFPLNILANKNDKEGKTYGNITGGRVLAQVGNELRLLSGSIRDIETEFEAMKKRQNVDYGIFYTLDNGSYNRGLRTYDKTFTTKDLRNYDEQNSGDSGNFMYIKDNYQKFPSDTVLTPNIRTKDSESYKKGHSDVNEQKGVVLHHTAFMENSLDGVTDHFLDTNSESSSHVVIGYDGKRRVFATPDKVTFHSGSSYFNGRDNVNDFMIGIEFQGDTNKKPLTQEQIDSAVEYLAPIIRANGISLENITTHQNVRDLYNQYRKEYNLGKKAPSKPDITFEEYQRIIEALKQKVYYKKYDVGGPLDIRRGLLRRFDGGGTVPDSTSVDTSRVLALAKRINETSNADFVRRLLDKNRRTLAVGGGEVATHRLGYVDDGAGNAVVFPEVQSSDYGDLLVELPYPLSYERAVERGDTVHMSTPDAELFTRNYKMVYPGFDNYACGGLLRQYQDGGDKESRTRPRSVEEYVQQQRDSVRNAALENSRVRKYPKVPVMEIIDGKPKYGLSCLYTALDNYGTQYLVAGNKQFASSPQKYGFKRIQKSELLPGDVVQDVAHRYIWSDETQSWQEVEAYPAHGMIFNGYNDDGIPTYNYSDGSQDPQDTNAIVTGGRYPSYDAMYYRFVGLPEDLDRWNREYWEKYPPFEKLPEISPVLPTLLPLPDSRGLKR